MIALLAALAAPHCPPEYRLDATVARAEAQGGAMIDLVPIPGANVDEVLVVTFDGGVGFIPFKDGCIVGPPFKYDDVVRAKGTPA